MRSLTWIFLIGWLALSPLLAAPTVQEQANYDAACLAVVEAVNAYRVNNGKAPLDPLLELCRAAREDSEFRHLGVGDPSQDIFDRAAAAGYAGTYLTGVSTAFDSKGQVAAPVLFQRLLSTNSASFLSDEAVYIGVGLALKAEGVGSEYRLRLILGKAVPGGAQDGTPTQELGTMRGLLDIGLLREMRAGAWSGDSINGFVRDPKMIVLTVEQEKAFAAALAAFVRTKTSLTIPAGRGVNLQLPPQVAKLIERLVLKGRFPPGIRYDRRTNRFTGVARGSGTYTVTLSGDLRGPVKGSEKLKPIRIRFTIQ